MDIEWLLGMDSPSQGTGGVLSGKRRVTRERHGAEFVLEFWVWLLASMVCAPIVHGPAVKGRAAC